MRVFYSFILALFFLVACSQENHKGQTTYTFSNQDNQKIKIDSNINHLEVLNKDDKFLNKIVFIAFFDLDSKEFKNYIHSINNLKATYPKSYFVGILTKNYPQEEINTYIKENNIEFDLLNPNDKKNFFLDFKNKLSNSNKDDTESNSESKEENLIPLPFFALYGKHGKLYQTYTGIIPEEMFSFDISTLIKKY